METIATIDIDRPAAEVFDFVADMANNPRWQGGQERCTWTSEPPIGLGSTYDQEARFLGRKLVSSFEVVEFEPGHLIRIVSTGGSMPIDVTRSVLPLPEGGCSVTAVVKGTPPLALRLLGPLTRAMMRSSVSRDYHRLKDLLEARA